jgi:hypothetical protein
MDRNVKFQLEQIIHSWNKESHRESWFRQLEVHVSNLLEPQFWPHRKHIASSLEIIDMRVPFGDTSSVYRENRMGHMSILCVGRGKPHVSVCGTCSFLSACLVGCPQAISYMPTDVSIEATGSSKKRLYIYRRTKRNILKRNNLKNISNSWILK